MSATTTAAQLMRQAVELHHRAADGRPHIATPDLLAIAGLCDAAAMVAGMEGNRAARIYAEAEAERYRTAARAHGTRGLAKAWAGWVRAMSAPRPPAEA